MKIREANILDIKEIQLVRNSVKENILSSPSIVTDDDCKEYLTIRGKGWVCEIDHKIIGFSIVDLRDHNIWALFVRPEFEKMGIGKKLHDTMLEWYFKKTEQTVWLSTSANTRAEMFYRECGWAEVGKHGVGEIKFEMPYGDWAYKRSI